MMHTAGGLRQRIAAVLAAAGMMACLTGCEIAGFTLPDIDIKLPELNLGSGDIPFLGTTTDPAEALDALTGEAAVTSPTIRESGVFTVGINSRTSLAPMVMSATDGSSIFGMDVDVAAALADELGLKVRYVAVEDTDAAVASTVDVVLSTPPDAVETATVVGSYAEDALGFFHKGEATVVDASALMGARVGVQPGSASKAALEHTMLGMVATDYDTLNDAFAALEAGEVDYVLCDAYAGAYLATGYDDIAFAGSINAPSVRGVAVSASNTALQQAVQQALTAIQGNGVLDVLRLRWVGELPALTSAQQIANIPQAEEQKPEDTEADESTTEGTEEDELS